MEYLMHLTREFQICALMQSANAMHAGLEPGADPRPMHDGHASQTYTIQGSKTPSFYNKKLLTFYH